MFLHDWLHSGSTWLPTNCEVIETHGDTAMVLKSYAIILLHGELVPSPPKKEVCMDQWRMLHFRA